VNIFDFDEMIYGERLKIEFIATIREELKFNNLDELKEQLRNNRCNTSEMGRRSCW